MVATIEIELVIVEPILLELQTAPVYSIGTALAGPQGTAGVNGTIEVSEGAKYSSLNAGTFGEISIDDDYLYICVKTGTAGNATWKRTVLFAT